MFWLNVGAAASGAGGNDTNKYEACVVFGLKWQLMGGMYGTGKNKRQSIT